MTARTAFFIVALLALLACGGKATQVAQETRPVRPSAEETLRHQFERAYFAIACIANHGKNPTMSITPMRRPADYLAAIEGSRTQAETRIINLLAENGFPGIAAFRNLETRLRGDRAYWSTIEDRFIPELERCPK